jgi:uncharacterized protein YhfF
MAVAAAIAHRGKGWIEVFTIPQLTFEQVDQQMLHKAGYGQEITTFKAVHHSKALIHTDTLPGRGLYFDLREISSLA